MVVERRGEVVPDLVLDDLLESEECFRPVLGRTHPSGVASPSGVAATDSSGALFDRVWFVYSIAFVPAVFFFVRRLCGWWSPGLSGTRAREERESLWESSEKVSIASWREEFDRERRVS